MSETVIITIISSSISVISALLGVFLTQFFNVKNETCRVIEEKQAENLKAKREKLDSVYKKLIRVVNLFPSQTPLDVLNSMDGPPNYNLENFDIVNSILEKQINYYEKLLNDSDNLDFELKNKYEIEINNREYFKSEITLIRDKYKYAQSQYEEFKRNEKMTFELYAGVDVKNNLVNFEILLHNAFIAGRRLNNDVKKINKLDISRWTLIDSIRNDLGIN